MEYGLLSWQKRLNTSCERRCKILGALGTVSSRKSLPTIETVRNGRISVKHNQQSAIMNQLKHISVSKFLVLKPGCLPPNLLVEEFFHVPKS